MLIKREFVFLSYRLYNANDIQFEKSHHFINGIRDRKLSPPDILEDLSKIILENDGYSPDHC